MIIPFGVTNFLVAVTALVYKKKYISETRLQTLMSSLQKNGVSLVIKSQNVSTRIALILVHVNLCILMNIIIIYVYCIYYINLSVLLPSITIFSI